MSSFTYETENRCERLETYEWDNVWWEHADTEGVPRVLYIGDSISCATRRTATGAAGETIFFDGFGTSKALDNPYFADSIRLFRGSREAVRLYCSTTACTDGTLTTKRSMRSTMRKCCASSCRSLKERRCCCF